MPRPRNNSIGSTNYTDCENQKLKIPIFALSFALAYILSKNILEDKEHSNFYSPKLSPLGRPLFDYPQNRCYNCNEGA